MSVPEAAPTTGPATIGPQEATGATPGAGAIPAPPAGPAPDGAGATPPAGEGSDRLETALKAERDARKKAEKDLADLRKQQTAGLSESERLAQRVAELEAANKQAAREALVSKIAMETGLSSLLAARLQGDDETSLRADAEALKQAIPQQPQTPTPVGGPQGQPVGDRSPEDWIAVLRQRR